MENAMVMNPKDNVAVCLAKMNAGETIGVEMDGKAVGVALKDAIPFGHKFALRPIGKGENVIKYGEVIGVASCSIEQGRHVHIHNIESIRARGDKQ